MSATYTYLNLRDEVFDPIKFPSIGSSITTRSVLNRGVRKLLARVHLRSLKRRAALSPNLFDDEYDYAFPSDGAADGIVDVAPQIDRDKTLEWLLTTPEEFDRMKADLDFGEAAMAVQDFDLTRKLRLSLDQDLDELVISSLDALTSGGGTWAAIGGAELLAADAADYVKGAGSIRWNIGATGGLTTAGIANATLDAFDLSDYVTNNRSVFAWQKIVSTTNLTNWILEIGSDASNYYKVTVTVQADATAFRNGWNLLRFDFGSKTTTGTPVPTACRYAALYMTKTTGKVSETGYRSDHLIAEEGRLFDLYYYSRFGWQTAAGVYIADSTADTDLVNAEQEEFDLLAMSCRLEAARDISGFTTDLTEKDLKEATLEYRNRHPSQAKLLITTR